MDVLLKTSYDQLIPSKQDLLANPKCSLLVARDPEERSELVITLHGDAVAVSLELILFLMYIIRG